ncbi:hypothetical protein OGAPHI_003276 [Ogataea philodendri]|uniref:Uncharacterized protein n=1 Tax=Ogataea philodendri TaxID=1378263 RepID=A0A9P8P7L9_9ASCO|nr:uncharacterized protein OGAPHI_003276 [Ogataea philodendri]KAH3666827.1 hypothetical protein OGAPHI_003276 [Ogataea philodendri]
MAGLTVGERRSDAQVWARVAGCTAAEAGGLVGGRSGVGGGMSMSANGGLLTTGATADDISEYSGGSVSGLSSLIDNGSMAWLFGMLSSPGEGCSVYFGDGGRLAITSSSVARVLRDKLDAEGRAGRLGGAPVWVAGTMLMLGTLWEDWLG